MPTDEGEGTGSADGFEESRAEPHSPHARHLLPEGKGNFDVRSGAWNGRDPRAITDRPYSEFTNHAFPDKIPIFVGAICDRPIKKTEPTSFCALKRTP